MTAGIYFGKSGARSSLSQRVNFSRWSLEAAFRLGGWLVPHATVRLARRLLFTPGRAARAGELPSEYHRSVLETTAGKLVVHTVGEGPVILFSHGWSGNAVQFKPLMHQVVNAGYSAVALDHYGHGESGGSDSNFLLFIRALKLLNQHLANKKTPVYAVVGHSIGGIASLHAFDARQVPHLLISPVIGFYQRFHDCAVNAGLNEGVFKAAVVAIEAAHGLCFAKVDEKAVLRNPDVRVHLLHSRHDRVVPAKCSINFQARAPHLGMTLGAEGGHSSVLNHLSTSAVLLSWLAQESGNGMDQPASALAARSRSDCVMVARAR